MFILCLLLALGTTVSEQKHSPLEPDALGRRTRSDALHTLVPEPGTSLGWVFFTDKGLQDEAQLWAEWQRLRPRPAGPARFRKPDALDLPVSEHYVAAVAATGAKIRHASRWFNAVSVQASQPQWADILKLPCVAFWRPVARGRRAQPKPVAPMAATAMAAAYPLDYGLSLLPLLPLQVPELHALGLSGRNVLVAVLDSGFKLTHRAFDELVGSGRVLDRWDFVRGDTSVANDSLDVAGQDFHGSEVLSTMTGVVAGELQGVAPGAAFLLAKTEDIASETPVEEDHYVAALEWADSLGASVVTSSLSYDFGYTMDGTDGISTQAANTAAARGLLLVTAMGNEGPEATTLGAPADAFNIVSVGAVDAAGVIAAFSSRGPTADGRIKPEVVAQGVAVYAADPSGTDGFVLVSGTSFSTPLTSASAVLLAEAHPDWSPAMLREALMQSGDRSAAPDNDYGWGRFRLLAALDGQPEGALVLEPRWYDAGDSGAWRLAVHAQATEAERKPAEIMVNYERVPGAKDSVALIPNGDTLWEALLPYSGETRLRWRLRARDSLGRVCFYPPDPHRRIEFLRRYEPLAENFELGGLRWLRGGTHPSWWPSAAGALEGTFSLSDSPGGGYPDSCDAWTMTRLPVCVGPDGPWSLRFFTRYEFGSGDSGKVEWRVNADTAWQVLDVLSGTQPDWLPRAYALPALPGDSVWLRFRLVSDAAVSGDGWYLDLLELGGNSTGVSEPPQEETSNSVLSAPVPNPFNQSTLLGFELDRPAEARLFVYDVLGRRVRTLWTGGLRAGPHGFEWDGTDDRGRKVASGLYLARLEVDESGYTRKLMLLK